MSDAARFEIDNFRRYGSAKSRNFTDILLKKTYLKFDVIITRCGGFHLPANFVIHDVIKAENFLRLFVVQVSVFPGSSVWIKLVLQYKIMDRLVRKTILGNLFTITSTMTQVSFFLVS